MKQIRNKEQRGGKSKTHKKQRGKNKQWRHKWIKEAGKNKTKSQKQVRRTRNKVENEIKQVR